MPNIYSYVLKCVFSCLQDECYDALKSISRKINRNDADMRSHVILSMIKVAAAEADVPDLPPSGSPPGFEPRTSLLVFNVLLVTMLSTWWYSAVTRTGRTLWRKWCYYYNYCWHLGHFICFGITRTPEEIQLMNNIKCSVFADALIQDSKSVLCANADNQQDFLRKQKQTAVHYCWDHSTFLRLILWCHKELFVKSHDFF